MDASTVASGVTLDTVNLILWLRGLLFVGLVVVFALGFQSGQRYG
ncbi:MAG: hypothetical protein P4L87_16995 [Formivibrio sp.]|nr:hypothetical protein [Formivibrio sp.]MDR3539815.1 hypothetical protein [Desulfosporosinus sp.]